MTVGRAPVRLTAALRAAAGLCVAGFPVLWAADPFGAVTQRLVVEQFLVAELVAALGVVFLAPGRGWMGHLSAGLSLCLGVLLFGFFAGGGALFVTPNAALVAQACGLLLLVLAAVWLSSGRGMAVFLAVMLCLGFAAQVLPPPFDAAPISAARYLVYFTFGGEGLLGNTLQVMAGMVLVYVMFGMAFGLSGGNDYLDQLVRRIAANSPGAPIKATILSSGLSGMASGSATANVLTSGVVTIPAMRQYGVPRSRAAGIEAMSSTLGQVTPPVMGAAAFLMAGLTELPYGQIALAAAVPVVIVYWVMLLQAHRMGQVLLRRGDGRGQEAPALPRWAALLRPSALVQIVPILLILAMVSLNDRMTVQAGLWGTLAAAVIAIGRSGPRRMLAALRAKGPDYMATLAQLVIIGSGLGIVIAVLGSTGLDVSLTVAVTHVGGQSLLVGLIVAAGVSLLLGVGLPTSSAYVIVGTLVAPGLVGLGLPVISAHLFVLYFAILSMVTPPVALAAFAASSIAGSTLTATAAEALRFGWAVFLLPFAFVYCPGLVLQGTSTENGLSIMAAGLALTAAQRALATDSRVRRWVACLASLTAVLGLIAIGRAPEPWPLAALAMGGIGLIASAWVKRRPSDARRA